MWDVNEEKKFRTRPKFLAFRVVWIPRLCYENRKLPHLPGDSVGDWFPVLHSPYLFPPSLMQSPPPQWRWPVLGLVMERWGWIHRFQPYDDPKAGQRTTCCSYRSLGKGRELLNLFLVVNSPVIKRKIEMCSKMRVSEKHFFSKQPWNSSLQQHKWAGDRNRVLFISALKINV